MSMILTLALMLWQAETAPPAPPPVTRAPAVVPPPPGVRAASSRWRVDYGDQHCMAIREYGTGPDQLVLTLTRAASLNQINIGIAGPSVPRRDATPEMRYAFDDGPLSEPREVDLVRLPQNGGRAAGVRVDLDEHGEALGRATVLRVAIGQSGSSRTGGSASPLSDASGDYRLDVRQMPAILGHLQRCHDLLLAAWGYDVAAARVLRSGPMAIGGDRWINENLLPGFTGRAYAAVLLNVSAAGRVTACRTIDSSGLPNIDAAICSQISQNGRYEPAIGADGLPAPSQTIRIIRYLS